jgi:hypothetical protein
MEDTSNIGPAQDSPSWHFIMGIFYFLPNIWIRVTCKNTAKGIPWILIHYDFFFFLQFSFLFAKIYGPKKVAKLYI